MLQTAMQNRLRELDEEEDGLRQQTRGEAIWADSDPDRIPTKRTEVDGESSFDDEGEEEPYDFLADFVGDPLVDSPEEAAVAAGVPADELLTDLMAEEEPPPPASAGARGTVAPPVPAEAFADEPQTAGSGGPGQFVPPTGPPAGGRFSGNSPESSEEEMPWHKGVRWPA